MKSFSYNPTVALSILLAAVFLEKYPEAEVKISEKKGTDFLSKLEVPIPQIVTDLSDEAESERSTNIAIGIITNLHDITVFENQFTLLRIFKGDLIRIDAQQETGKIVSKFIESPAFEKGVKVFSVNHNEDETVDGPVTDVNDPDPDPNSEKAVVTDVK